MTDGWGRPSQSSTSGTEGQILKRKIPMRKNGSGASDPDSNLMPYGANPLTVCSVCTEGEFRWRWREVTLE